MAVDAQVGMQEALEQARRRTLSIVAHLTPGDLERVLDPIMSPLAWDLGHIAAYEDLWIGHRVGGLPLLHDELAALYDAFETPRAVRGDLEFLRGDALAEYMTAVRERTLAVTAEHGVTDRHELVLRHELQHDETMLQALALAGLLPDGWGRPAAVADADAWITVPGGTVAIGADEHGFAYDNERPRHAVEVAPFRIARRPVTNATWLTFTEGGGYERRPWWSHEAWMWKEEYDIGDCPAAVRTGDPDAPVAHISWFEADAFARWADARLPTEFEWEKAATSALGVPTADSASGGGFPDTAAGRRVPVGSLPGTGQVWEWTASPFAAYPGFRAYPYREYSEPFFGDRYRVLRGGSCVTHPRVATTTFRNWDLPQRRQLFAGVRLAKEA